MTYALFEHKYISYIYWNKFILISSATKGTLLKGNASVMLTIKPEDQQDIDNHVFPVITKDLGFVCCSFIKKL